MTLLVTGKEAGNISYSSWCVVDSVFRRAGHITSKENWDVNTMSKNLERPFILPSKYLM
jgi:hypothetical protein